METSSASPAVDSILSAEVDLVNAVTALPPISSELASLSGNCEVLHPDLSSMEKTIEEKFVVIAAVARPSNSLEPSTSEKRSTVLPATEKVKEEEHKAAPHPELRSLCANMDFRGLLSYVIENRKEIFTICRRLGSALRLARNPVAFVLNSLGGFFPPKEKDDDLQVQLACVHLLDGLRRLPPQIKRSDRKRANLLAAEWKGKLSGAYKDNTLAALALLHLVVIFELVQVFGIDCLFDLLVMLIRRKQSDELCQSFDLEDMLPVFVNKLGHRGKQIEAIRLVFEFNLMDKCSPSSLLDTYIKGAKSASKRVRKKCKSQLPQIEAISGEIGALKIAIKICEDYKLCAASQNQKFHNRIEHLEKQMEGIKHTIAIGNKPSGTLNEGKECTASATGIKHLEKQKEKMKRVATTFDSNTKGQMQNQHQPNKRLRLSASAVSAPSPPHEHTQFTLVHQPPHMSSGGLYSLVEAPSIYGHVGVS